MNGIPSRVKHTGKLLKLVGYARLGKIIRLEYEEYESWQITSKDGDCSVGIPGRLTVSYTNQKKEEEKFKKKSETQVGARITVEYELDNANQKGGEKANAEN
ncbi:MAG: hypothetical protein ACE5J0_03235 [Candidatus Paceibacterales bacterium]